MSSSRSKKKSAARPKKLGVPVADSSLLLSSPSTSSANPLPSSSLAKLPKFTKKKPSQNPSPEEPGRPSMWQLRRPLAPLPPNAIVDLKIPAAEMCDRYIHYFEQKKIGVEYETPTEERHYACKQGWVLEYTNTVWEDDCSQALQLFFSRVPYTIRQHDLLFCGPPDLRPGESMHRCSDYSGGTRCRAWAPKPPQWSYDDILTVRRMYNFGTPHLPYVLQARYPQSPPVTRGSYPLDWFVGTPWLKSFRPRLIEAHGHYERWLAAARFLYLDCSSIDLFRLTEQSNDLIQAGLEGETPSSVGASGTKYTIPSLVSTLEDDEGQLRGIARYLMHRIVDHVAIANGLDPPQFGVDHALLGAFFSVAEEDFPLAELERHGVPLHGVRILEDRRVQRLCPLTMRTDPQCQIAADAVLNRPRDRSHGEFLEIWEMKRADKVNHPSRWSIKYPLDLTNKECHLLEVYNALFGSGLRHVDSAMAGALADTLGPATITLCDSVPLPPLTPPAPPTPPPVNPTASLIYEGRHEFAEDNDEYDDYDDDENYLDFGGGVITSMSMSRKEKDLKLVRDARADPRWEMTLNDMNVTRADPAVNSAERERILDIVRAAQQKSKTGRSALELYVLRFWSHQGRSDKMARKFDVHSSTQPGAGSSNMAAQGREWSGQADRGRKRPRSSSPSARGRDDYRGSYNPTHDRYRRRSRSPSRSSYRHDDQQHHRTRRGWQTSRSPRPRYPDDTYHDHRQCGHYHSPPHASSSRPSYGDPHPSHNSHHSHDPHTSSGDPHPLSAQEDPSAVPHASKQHGSKQHVGAEERASSIPPAHNPVQESEPLQADIGHAGLEKQSPELPTVSPSPGRRISLDERASPAPSRRMSVDEVLPTLQPPTSLLRRMSVDEVLPTLQPPTSLLRRMSLDEPPSKSQIVTSPPPPDHPAPTPTIVPHSSDSTNVVRSDEPANVGTSSEPPPGVFPIIEDAMEDESKPRGSGLVPHNLDPVTGVGQWFRIEFSGVVAEVSIKQLFQFLAEDRLVGVRVRKNKTGGGRKLKKVQLAFKSQQRCYSVLNHFRDAPGYSPWPFASVTTLPVDHQEALSSYRYLWDPEYVELSYAHQQSPDDLALLLRNAPACREIGDLRDLHPFPPQLGDSVDLRFYIRYRFLDFHRYPPLVSPRAVPLSAPRLLDRVEFTTGWLLAMLDKEYSTVRRRLSIIVRAHTQRDPNRSILPFWVPLLVTDGPYDWLIREVAIRAKNCAVAGDADVSLLRSPRPRYLESCGFIESQHWYVEWDSNMLSPGRRLNIGEGVFAHER